MRKLLSLLALYFLSVTLVAQEHIRFMGIPLGGQIDSFIEKLEKERGFRETTETDTISDIYYLDGEYRNFKNVRLVVASVNKTKIVGTVSVHCDSTVHNQRQVESLIDEYNRMYGKAERITDYSYTWKVGENEIYIISSKNGINIYYEDYTEVEAKNKLYKRIIEFNKKRVKEEERNKIKEICGIPFGSTYQKVLKITENKFGRKDIISSNNLIAYSDKYYAGIMFSKIYFQFQSDGENSYFNDCMFVISKKTYEEAKEQLDILLNKLSQKYTVKELDDEYGKSYYGGISPLSNEKIGFVIGLMKHEETENEYSVCLRYGPYNYVNEEF